LASESISPEKLSNEDLGKALDDAREITKSEVIERVVEDVVISDDGVAENEPEESTETSPETQPEAAKEPEKAPPTVEERLAMMEKRLKDKEDFIAKQGEEIGKLRKAVAPEATKKLHDVTADNFFEDPIKNVEKITENQRIRLEQEQELRTQAIRDEIERRRGITKQIAPDYEENLDSVAEVLKQDGFDDEGIKAFKSNPFAYDPPLLHNLNARAKLAKENAALKEEINRLKGNPKKILDKVENLSRQKPKISSGVSSGQDSEEIDIDSLSEKQIARLTNKQLEELLKKKTKR
jgi:hypothetical protein